MRNRTLVPVAAALALTLGTAAYAGAARDGRDTAPPPGVARQALAEARAALHGTPVARPTARDATMALRDLAIHRSELTGTERRAAEAILSRPTEPGDDDEYSVPSESVCGTHTCVHWVESSDDAVSSTDVDLNSVPDYVDSVLATLEQIHTIYVGAGYRPPKPDGAIGGSARTDIYLADVGPDGLYGYCTSDQTPIGPPWDVWAYCVLDNDYAPDEFPSHTPIENMQVTAAHEYFHAVQFAYDVGEDGWFMEGTATWAEDELFDGVDDNVAYLDQGQLGDPLIPLDAFAGLNVYGNWIFFRLLTERYAASTGALPTLVRTMWQHADAAPGGPDRYSLQAVAGAIRQAGGTFARTYAQFADGNRRPWATYEEGEANDYPSSPLAFNPVTLTPATPRTTWGRIELDHLTSATAQLRPKRMKSTRWRLAVQVDLAPVKRGSAAVVSVYFRDGDVTTTHLTLDKKGDAAKKVPFSSNKVRAVEVTLVNASTRTTCWTAAQPPPYSCFGTPHDDDLLQKLRGVATR